MAQTKQLTLPPVLLARQDTTTSTGFLKAAAREARSLTLPNSTSAPAKSCTRRSCLAKRLCWVAVGSCTLLWPLHADGGGALSLATLCFDRHSSRAHVWAAWRATAVRGVVLHGRSGSQGLVGAEDAAARRATPATTRQVVRSTAHRLHA